MDRKKLLRWHSLTALVAMLPLFVVSITGSILVFKPEIDSWLMPDRAAISVSQASSRLSFDELYSGLAAKFPDKTIATWEVFNDRVRSDAVYLVETNPERWWKVYLNPYSGEVLSEPVALTHYITDWLVELHYTFLLKKSGMFVGFVIALGLLLLAITGVFIYRRFWLNLFRLRWRKANVILFGDIHRLIGITSVPVLFLLAFTGAYWNMAELIHEIGEEVTPHIIQKRYSIPDSIDNLRNRAKQEIPQFNETYIVFPYEKDGFLTFYGEIQDGNPFYSEYASFVGFDEESSAPAFSQDIRQAHPLAVFLDSFRKLHFGHVGGLITQILWCVLGMAPVWLALTGLYLYAKRRRYSR